MARAIVACTSIAAWLFVAAPYASSLLNDLFDGDRLTKLTIGQPPSLHHNSDGIAILDGIDVLAVAHNADTPTAIFAAAQSGASAIEVDVVLVEGALYASHDVPHSSVGARFLGGRELETLWPELAQFDAVFLDLKQRGAPAATAVAGFLENKIGPAVFVSARDPVALDAVGDSAMRLLSVGTSSERDRALRIADSYDGVSVRHSLVDSAWPEDLLVVAWTVDDPLVLAGLADGSVDAVMTDNLAIIERASREASSRWGDLQTATS